MFGYPPDLSYKLYDRKAKCLYEKAGGQATFDACEALKKALEAVRLSSLSEKKREDFISGKLKQKKLNQIYDFYKWFSGVENLLAEWLAKVKDQKKLVDQNNDDRDSCPFKIWERHPMFPPLSDSLDIVYNEQVQLCICLFLVQHQIHFIYV